MGAAVLCASDGEAIPIRPSSTKPHEMGARSHFIAVSLIYELARAETAKQKTISGGTATAINPTDCKLACLSWDRLGSIRAKARLAPGLGGTSLGRYLGKNPQRSHSEPAKPERNPVSVGGIGAARDKQIPRSARKETLFGLQTWLDLQTS